MKFVDLLLFVSFFIHLSAFAQKPSNLSDEEYQALFETSSSNTKTPVNPIPVNPITLNQGNGNVANNRNFIDTSLILDVAGAYFDHDQNTHLGAHDPGNSGFNLQQLEMHMKSNVDPYFSMQANLVFSQFGVEIEEAYANTTSLPYGLKIKGGQFLTAFGRLNPTHPHQWSFVDQPWVNGLFFGGEGSRGLGSELSILMPLPWYVEIVSSLSEAKNACCARSFLGSNNLPVRNAGDLLSTSAIKQFFDLHSDLGLSLGLSYQVGPNATGQYNKSEIFGGDLYLRYRPVQSVERRSLSLQAEWMVRRQQRPNVVIEDFGGYIALIAQVFLRWESAFRYEKIGGKADVLLDPSWGRPEQRFSFQITFYPTHFSRLRLQLQRMETSQMEQGYGVMLNLETMIGSHGAHQY